MDDSENLAYQYLSSLGLGDVRYEPDGNVPPDFLVDGRIAVEVRRLNQNYVSESGTSGLEEFRTPLRKNMPKLLASLGPSTAGRSWRVDYRFRRPVPLSMSKLFQAIRSRLEAFRDGLQEGTEFIITNGFRLTLTPIGKPHSNCFIAGGCLDRDSGGYVIPELVKNIQICIQEKSRKVASVRANYPEWWLILIDQINDGQRESLHVKHDWDKVIVVNPLNPICAYEV